MEVGAADDAAEREADVVADRIVRMLARSGDAAVRSGPAESRIRRRVDGWPARQLEATGGDAVIRRKMPPKAYVDDQSPFLGDPDPTIFKKLRRAFLLSLREAKVDDQTYGDHRARVYDDVRSMRERLTYIRDVSAAQNLHGGAEAKQIPVQPDNQEQSALDLAVRIAAGRLTEIGRGSRGAAQQDPVANIFPENPGTARGIFTAAATELQRLHATQMIFKVVDQPAKGLTSPTEMKLSGAIFADILRDPTSWAAQQPVLHESFHIVSAAIKDEGGYRPEQGGDASAFLARPYAQRVNSAPHYEEVVWQYTGEGGERAVALGAASPAMVGLFDAQDLLQIAWAMSLTVVKTIAEHIGKPPSADCVVYSLMEGLAVHRDMERVGASSPTLKDRYHRRTTRTRMWQDARVTELDYSLAKGVTAALSLAYGKVKDLVPSDPSVQHLPSAGGTQQQVTRGIVDWVLGIFGPIRKDGGRDRTMVEALAGRKGVGPDQHHDWNTDIDSLVNKYVTADDSQ
jgi:hypothetical protein